jgi:hypothetical protein
LEKGILIMFSKLTIAFAVVVGLTSASFAQPLSWHAPPNSANNAYAGNAYASNAHASSAYASAVPATKSPENFGRTWDPYGMRWE